MKILVVDDEKVIVKAIKFNLERDGYTVEVAYDGEEALKIARDKTISLVILDLMLPKIDGLTVCQKIREFSNVPIIMVTAKTEDMDKIMGLEYGADDYVTKPFNILELKARVKAILRRVTPIAPNGGENLRINTGSVELDYNRRTVTIGGKTVDLTGKEFDLMDLLVSNAGKVYSRESLLDLVWGYEYPGDIRTVDVHVRRLREKIEPNSAEPVYLLTKWGAGYYFKDVH
ncbi:MAG: response regulator transcription factor [Clostridia bacterium]|nr:response regulator transcription factor [Clostridia bacterium]